MSNKKKYTAEIKAELDRRYEEYKMDGKIIGHEEAEDILDIVIAESRKNEPKRSWEEVKRRYGKGESCKQKIFIDKCTFWFRVTLL